LVLEGQQTELLRAVQAIWAAPDGKNKSHSLSSAFEAASAALEEPVVIVLVHVAHSILCNSACSASPIAADAVKVARSVGVRCAADIAGLERASSVLRMALHGNDQLQQTRKEVAAALRSYEGGRDGEAVGGAATAAAAAAVFFSL
jgi:hypothetical protein